MKVNKFLGGAALTVTALSLGSCTNESWVEGSKTVSLPVSTVITVPDNNTRTSLVENGGSLVWSWEKGDRVVAIEAASGMNIGSLKAGDPTDNGKSAVFTGNLNLPAGAATVDAKLFYIGKGNDVSALGSVLEIDATEQDGLLESLVGRDKLESDGKVVIKVSPTYAVIPDFSMNHLAAAGYFQLVTESGDNIADTDAVITYAEGKSFNSYLSVDLNNFETTYSGTAPVKSTTDADGKLYLTLIPGQDSSMKFSVNLDGKELIGYLGDSEDFFFNIEAGLYYCKANGEPLSIVMREELGPEDPASPGNSGNWGGNVDNPDVKYNSFSKIGNSSDAWCSNERVFNDFGFAAPAQFDYNGIRDGHLSSGICYNISKNFSQDARYFQWGRWLGFPGYTIQAEVAMLEYGANENSAMYPVGLDPNLNNNTRHLYYSWDMDSRPSYAYTTAWSSGMARQQAINSSIIFIANSEDYLKSNLRSLNWEERSGNPCPDGYRVPTAEELSVFVPSESFKDTYAEVKTIGSSNYAIRWERTAEQDVIVKMVRTAKSSVTVDDKIFDKAEGILLETAGGILVQDGDALFGNTFDNGTYFGGYWSTDMDGNGAKALMIRVATDGTVSIQMQKRPRTTGYSIMPFRDASAKATSIKPWFPLGY